MSDDEDWFERGLDSEEGEDLFTDEWAVEGTDDANGADDETDGTDAESAEHDGTDRGNDEPRPTAIEAVAAELDDVFEDIADEEQDPFAVAPVRSDDDGTAADGRDDPDGGLFDQDFGEALDGAPDLPTDQPEQDVDLGEEFDFGGEFDMGTDEFEPFGGASGFDDDPDSDLDRIALGIEGLDAMIQGGVPARSLMVAIGSAGTGKTTLGLQFLAEGLRNGERAVYFTLEESRRRVIRSATEKGFSFDEYAAEGDLAIVDIDPVEMANSLRSIRSELPRLVDEFGATRLVLDSVSLLEMMYDERATRRNEIYNFTKSLKRSGVTTLLTSEASEESAYASRHGIVEYLTDAVFVLQYIRPSDFQETRLAIEIQKIRDANHSRETKPYEITDEGINVYRQANIF